MPKLKPTRPRKKNEKQLSLWSHSSGLKGKTMEKMICGKDEFLAWSGGQE